MLLSLLRRRMSRDLDEALRTWDFYNIAKLNGRKEVKVSKPITVCYTPTQYKIKVKLGGK